MKRLSCILLILIGFIHISHAQEHRRYALIWHDEFNSEVLDNKVWGKIWRSRADWAVHMSSNAALYDLDGSDLVLRGMVNDFLPNDTAAFLTGGVWSRYRKSFGFGRLEIRAKFDIAQGFWPAIWMLPDANHGIKWPHGGEIDIMEHFRDNPYVNHTVHSHYTVNLGKRNRPSQVAYPFYNAGEYNTYGVERFRDSLVFFLNGERTFNYPRFRKGVDGQFPFSQHDFYLILDAQLGRDRSPYIDTTKLPVELRIDYVRYYEIDTKTDVIPEPKDYQQLKTKKKKFKKVVYNEKTHFDNPDEYCIVVKCGKATVSGNRLWAESTLAQLVDENCKIANLEVHDKPACPYRGVSLDKCDKELTFDDLNRLLDWMVFCKLNYLQWNEAGACSEEEVNIIKEYARDLGITMIKGGIPTIPDVDFIDVENNAQVSASNQIFLRTASKNGGWLFLKGLETSDLEALMAFSERYWRGGNAGEWAIENGLPDVLSPAGSRLANFMEKVAVCRERFHLDLPR
jgi:beta-glucanase (GH16 family)